MDLRGDGGCFGPGVRAEAKGHFQVLLPVTDVVTAADGQTLGLELLFTHPMEQGPVMEMGRPKRFGVLVGGEKRDLLSTLTARKLEGKTVYTCTAKVTAPGDYVFFVEPAPVLGGGREEVDHPLREGRCRRAGSGRGVGTR